MFLFKNAIVNVVALTSVLHALTEVSALSTSTNATGVDDPNYALSLNLGDMKDTDIEI